jgi:hypothetical protein
MSDLHPAAIAPLPAPGGGIVPPGPVPVLVPDLSVPAPLPVPTVSDDAVLLMHAILLEVMGVVGQLASQVPTASALEARLAALKARLAPVFDPPKKS